MQGRYIYCIISSDQGKSFGPLGMGDRGDEVVSVGYQNLQMVVSDHPLTKVTVNRENMLLHERVIEEVMKEFPSVLPVKFSTITNNDEDIRKILRKRYDEFKEALVRMNGKIEFGVKGVWKNIESIFQDIVQGNTSIMNLKRIIQEDKRAQTFEAKAELGRMVEDALINRKRKEADRILTKLNGTASDYKVHTCPLDKMFLNAAFLLSREKEAEFDALIQKFQEEENIKLLYTGPFPVFNFINIIISPEEWEK